MKRRQMFESMRAIDPEYTFEAANVIGRWMKQTKTAKEDIASGLFTKDDLDVATKYIQDTGLITATTISSWRKKLRVSDSSR
jgi:hypothetical protein